MKISQQARKLSVMELTITADLGDGHGVGKQFREKQLLPALLKYDRVEVTFNGIHKFNNSFLQEAFGGLIVDDWS